MLKINRLPHVKCPKFSLVLLLSAGLFSSTTFALDLGKVLEEAVKEKVEEVTNTGGTPSNKAEEKPVAGEPSSTTPTSTTTTTTSSSPVNAPATTSSTTEPKPSVADTPEFNWKKPSREEEIALGREITGNLLGAAPLVKDDKLQSYVNQVGRWVASQSERPDLPWRFGVIDSADINAFAMPGGYVLVTKGLYQKLSNEAQLAGVLGHEIAHIVKKHQLKVLQKQQLLNIGANKLKDMLGKKDKLAKKAIGSGAEISARSLDKDAEFEADRMGLILAARAGYDAYGLPEVLQTIGHSSKSDSSVALLFKTHPAPDERLAKLSDSVGSSLDKVKAGKTLENRLYQIK
jgi:beta-barrel assembly-enhancing protease